MTVDGGPVSPATAGSPLEILQRLRRTGPKPRPGERCEMCAVEIPDEHSHLVRVESRSLLCTCRPCYLLFTAGGSGALKYKAVPDRYLSLPGFALSRLQWEELQIPVSVAFFFANSAEERVVAFYPSPAGATECLLGLDAWERLMAANPAMPEIEPDVEALLVRVGVSGPGQRARTGGTDDAPECYVVPIDACYELVGHMRRLWRGFDGGQEVHDQMEAFFSRVRDRSRPAPSPAPAGAATALDPGVSVDG